MDRTDQSGPQTQDAEQRERAKPAPLADRVYDQISVRIASGEFKPNTKLPSEHDLAAMFGVSRPILRDALERLRSEGVIASRQGAGSYVRDRNTSTLAFSPVETIADIQRCYEFRLTIEPVAAYVAALRHDQDALRKMQNALDLLQDATRNQRHREDADFSFHLAISEAANNHYFSSTMLALREHIYVGMHMHGLSLLGAKPKLQKVLDEHRGIYQAIVDGRAEDAGQAMRKHLEGSRDRLFEGRTLDLRMSTITP